MGSGEIRAPLAGNPDQPTGTPDRDRRGAPSGVRRVRYEQTGRANSIEPYSVSNRWGCRWIGGRERDRHRVGGFRCGGGLAVPDNPRQSDACAGGQHPQVVDDLKVTSDETFTGSSNPFNGPSIYLFDNGRCVLSDIIGMNGTGIKMLNWTPTTAGAHTAGQAGFERENPDGHRRARPARYSDPGSDQLRRQRPHRQLRLLSHWLSEPGFEPAPGNACYFEPRFGNEFTEFIEAALTTESLSSAHHLRNALSPLADREKPDYPNLIKESISADHRQEHSRGGPGSLAEDRQLRTSGLAGCVVEALRMDQRRRWSPTRRGDGACRADHSGAGAVRAHQLLGLHQPHDRRTSTGHACPVLVIEADAARPASPVGREVHRWVHPALRAGGCRRRRCCRSE